MGAFLDWFFAFLTTMIDGIWKIISGIFGGIFQIFNVVDYVKQFGKYKGGFGFIDWIFAIISFLLVMVLSVTAIIAFVPPIEAEAAPYLSIEMDYSETVKSGTIRYISQNHLLIVIINSLPFICNAIYRNL